jgi:hypothetical protein
MLAVSSLPLRDVYKDLDALYNAILATAFDEPGLAQPDRDEMELVLRTILCAQEPLTVATIATILKLDGEDLVYAALRPLLSIVQVSETSGLVTTLHASFSDFMFDEHRSGKSFCDRARHHGLLAQLCFDVMKTPDPPFNICKLESSFLFDKDVSNLEEKINTSLSTALFYACQHWGAHMRAAEASPKLVNELHAFLSVRLLLWTEVLNLKRCLQIGAGSLSLVQRWAKVRVWQMKPSMDL